MFWPHDTSVHIGEVLPVLLLYRVSEMIQWTQMRWDASIPPGEDKISTEWNQALDREEGGEEKKESICIKVAFLTFMKQIVFPSGILAAFEANLLLILTFDSSWVWSVSSPNLALVAPLPPPCFLLQPLDGNATNFFFCVLSKDSPHTEMETRPVICCDVKVSNMKNFNSKPTTHVFSKQEHQRPDVSYIPAAGNFQ